MNTNQLAKYKKLRLHFFINSITIKDNMGQNGRTKESVLNHKQ